MKNKAPIFVSEPVESNTHYKVFVQYLESKDSPKAKRLLEKLKNLKTCKEYAEFREFLLFDLFIEIS